MSTQRTSLQGLNSHSLMRINTRTPIRTRNGRSQSPTRRGGSDEGSSAHRVRRSRSPDGNSRPLSTPEQAFFNTMATTAELDLIHRESAQNHAEVNGIHLQHIAYSIEQARTRRDILELLHQINIVSEKQDTLALAIQNQNVAINTSASDMSDMHASLMRAVEAHDTSSSSTAIDRASTSVSVAWVCSPELHELINECAQKLIITADLESYTALEIDNIYLAHSLFNSIKQKVHQRPTAWQVEHLPSSTGGVHDGVGTRLYTTHIRNACRHAREKLHNMLLAGIHDPKNGELLDAKVPKIKALWHRIANKFKVSGIHLEADSLWANTDKPTRARIAYLRREAVCIYQIGRGSSSIWACADAQLNTMRARGEDYTAMFYEIVYNHDIEVFNGKTLWKDLKVDYRFDLPSHDEVETAIDQQGQALVDPDLE